jgi:hypothetical protein
MSICGKVLFQTFSTLFKKTNEVMKILKSKSQIDICWTSTCAILLLHIQNASHRICPAFYYERRLSHNGRLLSVLSETENEKEKSLLLIRKELFIYNYFAKQNPQTVIDWNKTAVEGEQVFSEISSDILQEIIEPLFRFITTPQTPDYVHIHNTLITHNGWRLFELFTHIAAQVNYLKD